MRKNSLYFLVFGFLLGFIVGFVLSLKRKLILQKIKDIENKIKDLNLSDRLKENFKEILNLMNILVEDKTNIAKEEEEHILNIVEEKIKRLEQIIKS